MVDIITEKCWLNIKEWRYLDFGDHKDFGLLQSVIAVDNHFTIYWRVKILDFIDHKDFSWLQSVIASVITADNHFRLYIVCP